MLLPASEGTLDTETAFESIRVLAALQRLVGMPAMAHSLGLYLFAAGRVGHHLARRVSRVVFMHRTSAQGALCGSLSPHLLCGILAESHMAALNAARCANATDQSICWSTTGNNTVYI